VSPDVSVDAPDAPDGAPGQALKAKATKVGYATGLTNLIDDEEGATQENRGRKKMSGQINRFDYFCDARQQDSATVDQSVAGGDEGAMAETMRAIALYRSSAA
jgi:hypothetical protein